MYKWDDSWANGRSAGMIFLHDAQSPCWSHLRTGCPHTVDLPPADDGLEDIPIINKAQTKSLKVLCILSKKKFSTNKSVTQYTLSSYKFKMVDKALFGTKRVAGTSLAGRSRNGFLWTSFLANCKYKEINEFISYSVQ